MFGLHVTARSALFTGSGAIDAANRPQAKDRMEGLARVSTLIELLGDLARNSYRLVASPDYHLRHTGVRSEQVDTILRYLHRSFNNPIRMQEIAHAQGMTPSTFSRFSSKSPATHSPPSCAACVSTTHAACCTTRKTPWPTSAS